MYIKLSEIAAVAAGHAFRGAIKSDPDGAILVFQAKDLIQGQPFNNTASLTRISHELPGYSGHLRKNDVLLVSRGMKSGAFRSTVFVADDLNVVASSSVHVIRITSPEVLSEYISLFLNSREGQAAITNIISGSYIGAVPRRELEKIRIPKLPLSKQRALLNLHRNIQQQQKILDRRKEIRQDIISAALENLMYEK